jgi:hypothetical protein
MPVRPKRDRRKTRLTPELRADVERLLELTRAHRAAIRGDDPAFYEDGRHEELADLHWPVIGKLGIKPWEDAPVRLQEVLDASS